MDDLTWVRDIYAGFKLPREPCGEAPSNSRAANKKTLVLTMGINQDLNSTAVTCEIQILRIRIRRIER